MEEKFLHAEEPEAERNSQFLTRRDLSSSPSAKSFPDFDLSLVRDQFGLGKLEKLKSRKTIDQLFKEGKSVSTNGFTLVYLVKPLYQTHFPAIAGFSVPKKFFKHAVDRNRIKRLMREVYRKNKYHLYEQLVLRKEQMAIMFVYKGKTLPDYGAALKAVTDCLGKITKT